MGKEGFNNQWIEVFRAGTHLDNRGLPRTLDEKFLDAVCANFDCAEHEPPAVIGHPADNAPAYGWASALKREGASLYAQFSDTDDDFEELVKSGKFKKRSASFYTDAAFAPGGRAPALRHVGFLGAQPPAVKGLRAIQFHEDDSASVFEISFDEGDFMNEEQQERVANSILDKLKAALGLDKKDEPVVASFSEADVKAAATAAANEAVAAATANFSEDFRKLKEANEKLQQQLAAQSGKSQRGEIIAFCESLGAEKMLPAFRRMGIVEFMETLAALPAESKVATIEFAEDGSETKAEVTALAWFQNFMEILPRFLTFSEQYARLNQADTKAADQPINEALYEGMGVKPKTDSAGGDK